MGFEDDVCKGGGFKGVGDGEARRLSGGRIDMGNFTRGKGPKASNGEKRQRTHKRLGRRRSESGLLHCRGCRRVGY